MRLSEAQKEAVHGRYPDAKLSRVGTGWFVIGFQRKNVDTATVTAGGRSSSRT